ncbi:hypothetical protein ACC862_37770, partial [Rhizobium ruizarguesonis]
QSEIAIEFLSRTSAVLQRKNNNRPPLQRETRAPTLMEIPAVAGSIAYSIETKALKRLIAALLRF